MERRELLKMIALATGSAVIGGEFLLSGCKNENAGSGLTFSEDDIAFLDELAETILPKTNTPGAKDAQVGKYMAIMVTDCYEAPDQQIFKAGIQKLNEESKKMFDTNFLKLSLQQKTQLLIQIDSSCKAFNKKVDDEYDALSAEERHKLSLEEHTTNKNYKKEKLRQNPYRFYTMMKQLTLSGFFTSEVGATKALRYIAVPGKFDGCAPYTKGEKAWATS